MFWGNFCEGFLIRAILLPNFEFSHELISFYRFTNDILFISIIFCKGSSTWPSNFFFHSLIALIYLFFISIHYIFLVFCLLLIFMWLFVSQLYLKLFMSVSISFSMHDDFLPSTTVSTPLIFSMFIHIYLSIGLHTHFLDTIF